MVEQHAHGDRTLVPRDLGEVLLDLVLEAQLALEREERHGRGGELLGDTARFEDGVRAEQGALLEIGGAVAFLQQHGATLRHTHHTAGSGARVLREHLVGECLHVPRGRGTRLLRGNSGRREHDDRDTERTDDLSLKTHDRSL